MDCCGGHTHRYFLVVWLEIFRKGRVVIINCTQLLDSCCCKVQKCLENAMDVIAASYAGRVMFASVAFRIAFAKQVRAVNSGMAFMRNVLQHCLCDRHGHCT